MQKIRVAVLNTWSSNHYNDAIAVVRLTEDLILTVSELQNIVVANNDKIMCVRANNEYSKGIIPCYFLSTIPYIEDENEKNKIEALHELLTGLFDDDDDKVIVAEMDERYLSLLQTASLATNEPTLNVFLGGLQFSETDDNGDLYESKDLSNLNLIKAVEMQINW